ncbi:MAG: flagellar biosynthesis protein FlhB [Angelakisella sp.]|nr:flagellar biosynthesis protein FlhB [Angelakisella sp.]MCI9667158.1 flagellar biosynthesis protein FlhB [Angelakisella sp.]
MAGEKTEKATPKRRQDERKKGNVFQSREIGVVFSLLVSFYGLKLLAPYILRALEWSIRNYFYQAATVDEIITSDAIRYFIQGCGVFAVAAMPLLLVCGAVSVIATLAQTRGLFTMKSAAPKFSRLNPIEGIKKMFSMRGVVELLKSLAKIIVLGYIIWLQFRDEFWAFPRLMDMEPLQGMAFTANIVLEIAKSAAIVMVFVAAADYFYQWWDYEKNLRMSKQELKEEYKQTEGDPQVKGKIRERQQAQARQRMMQKVPGADVVIRNPTHFAVALKYDPQRSSAPVVVAKGADSLALRIVAVAQENGVFITENKPLARGLYEAVDLDREIPDRFYQPVAEVLAFVYSLKKKELK